MTEENDYVTISDIPNTLMRKIQIIRKHTTNAHGANDYSNSMIVAFLDKSFSDVYNELVDSCPSCKELYMTTAEKWSSVITELEYKVKESKARERTFDEASREKDRVIDKLTKENEKLKSNVIDVENIVKKKLKDIIRGQEVNDKSKDMTLLKKERTELLRQMSPEDLLAVVKNESVDFSNEEDDVR